MARKILFRGISAEDHNWVPKGSWAYGAYSEKDPTYIIYSDFYWQQVKIIPETVGQYVRDDKDGKAIFEGDVFRFKFKTNYFKHIELFGSFTFGSDLSFEIDIYGNDEYVCLHYIDDGQFSDFELLGNCHINPEILENPAAYLSKGAAADAH